MADREAAMYVLAYLLRGKYEATATAFLQECTVLPSKSLLVLPEVPLERIISEHRAHKDTRVLVSAMGERGTWCALWHKLEENMSQLRHLSEELLSNAGQPSAGTRRRRKRMPPTLPHSATSHPIPSTLPSHPTPSTLPSHPTPSAHLSPQKRKSAPPKRVSNTSGASTGHVTETTPPDMQQVFEAMLENGSLPEKLAQIINHVVESDSGGQLSSEALDSILDLACAAPEFEGVLSSTDKQPSTANPLEDIPSQEQHNTEVPSTKRPRITTHDQLGLDIESFLDQIHNSQ